MVRAPVSLGKGCTSRSPGHGSLIERAADGGLAAPSQFSEFVDREALRIGSCHEGEQCGSLLGCLSDGGGPPELWEHLQRGAGWVGHKPQTSGGANRPSGGRIAGKGSSRGTWPFSGPQYWNGPVGSRSTAICGSAWLMNQTEVPEAGSVRRCSKDRHIASRRAIASTWHHHCGHQFRCRPSMFRR